MIFLAVGDTHINVLSWGSGDQWYHGCWGLKNHVHALLSVVTSTKYITEHGTLNMIWGCSIDCELQRTFCWLQGSLTLEISSEATMIVGFNMDIDGSWMIVIIILSGNTLEIQVLKDSHGPLSLGCHSYMFQSRYRMGHNESYAKRKT